MATPRTDHASHNPLHGKVPPLTSVESGSAHDVAPEFFGYTVQIVNVALVGTPRRWLLVDTGLPGTDKAIRKAAEDRFGSDARPECILLTHGHFDHAGAAVELAEYWDVPVYAHDLEMPYVTGRTAYRYPDDKVDGGLLAKLGGYFPTEPVDLGPRARRLPTDGSVPGFADWQWLHTPGHTAGHVSLFREADRALIAGDAFVTVRQDALYKVLTQHCEITGPPRYFTDDWGAARDSVRKLAALRPDAVLTGHGRAVRGDLLEKGLQRLAEDFDRIAMPEHGRYVDQT